MLYYSCDGIRLPSTCATSCIALALPSSCPLTTVARVRPGLPSSSFYHSLNQSASDGARNAPRGQAVYNEYTRHCGHIMLLCRVINPTIPASGQCMEPPAIGSSWNLKSSVIRGVETWFSYFKQLNRIFTSEV